MQDQEATKVTTKEIRDKVWGGIALFILLAVAVGFWSTVNKAPQAEWRNAHTSLPWEAAGVSIREAEAVWKNSKGDARMELRAYCYPSCRFVLDKAEGSGFISVRICDSNGNQIGDRERIHFSNGKFQPKQGNSVQVTENEAHIRLEDGFQTADLYKLHQIDEQEKYWTVEITCHPEGAEPEELGRLSILPHDL